MKIMLVFTAIILVGLVPFLGLFIVNEHKQTKLILEEHKELIAQMSKGK